MPRTGGLEMITRKPGHHAYWLFKTEPTSFSFDDLLRSPRRTTSWDGVRNYQARNMLRDDVNPGDLVFVYHSSSDPTGIAGIAEVVRGGYPDPTALDPRTITTTRRASPMRLPGTWWTSGPSKRYLG